MLITIDTEETKVVHSIRPDVNREFLSLSVPNGWDDVKKICKRVLTYDGRKFIFSGWNSDRNECFFYRMLDGSSVQGVARFE